MGSGCSLVFMKQPPSEDTIKKRQLKPEQIRCTKSYAAPIGDFLLGVASIETVIAPIILLPSALYGIMNASDCNRYVDETAEVYDELESETTAQNVAPRTAAPPSDTSATPAPPVDVSTVRQSPVAAPPPESSAPRPTKSVVQPVAKGACEGRANGAFCDDKNRCTRNERCQDGRCLGQPISCDDGLPCTRDLCKPDQGCVHRPLKPCCGDGERTPLEACDDGNRVAGDGCSSSCTIEMIFRRLDTRDVDGRYLSSHGDAQAQAEAFCRAAYYDDWAAQIPASFGTGEGYAYTLDTPALPPKAVKGPIQRHVQCRLPPP